MRPYSYHRPTTLAEARQLHGELAGARYVAGATDLLVAIKSGRTEPAALVSLRGVAGLDRIELTPDGAVLGATTRIADLATHAALRAAYPELAQACAALGTEQVRNQATLGGNLANASPCADTAPPLLVNEARARIAGDAGTRELPLADLFEGPGAVRLAPGEILTAIVVPPPVEGWSGRQSKARRVQVDVSLASVAVRACISEGRCRGVRIAAGAVAPVPLRLAATEALLRDQSLSGALLAEVRASAAAEVRPITDLRATERYRRHIVGVFVERCLRALAEEAGCPV